MKLVAKGLSAAAAAFALAAIAAAQDNAASSQLASAASQTAASKADPISQSAGVYATFHDEVGDVKDGPFSSASDIESALDGLGGHNPDEFTKGWIAYSALIASQDADFRTAIRDGESYYGREQFISGLGNDPTWARKYDKNNAAIAAALQAAKSDTRRLSGTADYVDEQFYTLSSSGWAKGKVGDANGLARRLKASSASRTPASSSALSLFTTPDINTALTQAGSAGAPSLWDGVSTAAGSVRLPQVRTSYRASTAQITPGKEPVADRIATLAAYRAIGAEATDSGAVYAAMSERGTTRCVKTSQVQLRGCVSAAYMHFEVVPCIAKHALRQVGECIGEVTQ